MPVVRRLLLAGALTAVAVGGGVAVIGTDEPGQAPPASTSTPLSSFDTSRVTILRTGFCERVPAASVSEALGAEATKERSYDNGDRVVLAPGVRDRAHEYGCSWTADSRTAAAWVFAPPVTRRTAGELVRGASSQRGCQADPDAPAYGAPSVALVCTSDRSREVSFRGLFGDAWLVCSLASRDVSAGQTRNQDLDRTGRWCVAVARAAAAEEAPG